jgi:autotransporter adhesin
MPGSNSVALGGDSGGVRRLQHRHRPGQPGHRHQQRRRRRSLFGVLATEAWATSTAAGGGAWSGGINSTALGNAAESRGANSVALGADSIADRDNTVSVGGGGNTRQITNVADGTQGNDAVNKNQLDAVAAAAKDQPAVPGQWQRRW